MGKIKDMTNMRFERLVVIERAPDRIQENGRRRIMWHCVCDCGNELNVSGEDLRSGHTRSCGCIHSEQLSNRNMTHGHSNDRLYGVWYGMKKRCYNKNSKDYKNYGGRGISVCEDWKNDYCAFRNWSYENGYNEGAEYGVCTLDRIDVNGNYCPENCRWADNKTQQRNKRNTLYLEYNGKVMTFADFSDIIPANRQVLYEDIYKKNKNVNMVAEKYLCRGALKKEVDAIERHEEYEIGFSSN